MIEVSEQLYALIEIMDIEKAPVALEQALSQIACQFIAEQRIGIAQRQCFLEACDTLLQVLQIPGLLISAVPNCRQIVE